MINSRKIDDLHPVVAKKAKAFVAACAKEGVDVLITSTYRDDEAQNALYAQGRGKPGKIVTNAKAGQSFHNFRVAWDFVPIINGKPAWNDRATFKRCGEIAEGLGCEWAGRWKDFKELAHVQFTGGLSLKDLKAGKTPDDAPASVKPAAAPAAKKAAKPAARRAVAKPAA